MPVSQFNPLVIQSLNAIVIGIAALLIVIYIVIRITNLQRRVDFEQQLSNLKLRFFTDISI